MPRLWKHKTNRIRKSNDEIKAAVQEVLNGSSIREVSKHYSISYSALQRHVHKAKNLPDGVTFEHQPNLCIRQIFSPQQEQMLANYLKKCSRMHYGLTTAQTKQLAYKYAKALNVPVPEKWGDEESAGREWLFGFFRRNPDLSLRAPEATSMSRSTSFNKYNVTKFFDNIQSVYERYNFTANDIWNCDETGLTTVHKPPRIVAEKGLKQVGQVTSGERGQLVTFCGFINSAGNTVPPAYIFPRKRNLDVLGHGAPSNSLILGSATGWMTADSFLVVFKHFVKNVRCTKDTPVVLFLDNHESHVTLEVIEEGRKSGVHLITYPPHCSHRLQPLDVGVYGPLKVRYNQVCDEWMSSNPGKSITIYNIAELSNKAFTLAFSKQNIIKSFEKTGIWPMNRLIFSDEDYLMSSVTDRPEVGAPVGSSSDIAEQEETEVLFSTPSTSRLTETTNLSETSDVSCSVSLTYVLSRTAKLPNSTFIYFSDGFSGGCCTLPKGSS